MGAGTFRFEVYVNAPVTDVWQFFSTANNLAQITAFPKVTIKTDALTVLGNIIEMELSFWGVKTKWHAQITAVEEGSYFVDEGIVLPFPFQSWKHRHEVKELGDGTIIRDIVSYRSKLPSSLMHLLLRMMFSSRAKLIKSYFDVEK